MKKDTFTIATIQASPVFMDLDATIEKASILIKKAAKKGAAIAVFPEAQKTNFLCRLKKTSFIRAKSPFASHREHKDIILEINAPKHLRDDLRKDNLPVKMKIRFVQVILDNGTVEVLVPNILSDEVLQTSYFM